jgi:hypothetical protein
MGHGSVQTECGTSKGHGGSRITTVSFNHEPDPGLPVFPQLNRYLGRDFFRGK